MGAERGEAGIQPIFVMGLARNGTTWLVNSLTKCDEIVTPSHWLHHGAHETNFAKYDRWYGRFQRPEEYLSFLGSWSLDDLFLLCEGDLDYFLTHPRRDYLECFFELMDRFACKRGARYWTVKMDPFLYWKGGLRRFWTRVGERYSDPKIVAIQRNTEAVISSYLKMEGRAARLRQTAARHWAYCLGYSRQTLGYTLIHRFVKRHEGVTLRYEAMKEDKADLERELDTYLGVEGSLGVGKQDIFEPNSSFLEAAERDGIGCRGPRRVSRRLASAVCKSVLVSKTFVLAWELIRGENYPAYHRLIMRKRMPEVLRRDLEERNAHVLVRRISACAPATDLRREPLRPVADES